MPRARATAWLLPALLAAATAAAEDVRVRLPAGDGFVVEDSTGATEHFRVDEATGDVLRNGQRFLHTTGIQESLYLGELAGELATGGFRNVGIGADTLDDHTIATENTALGSSALTNLQSGAGNVALGYAALGNLVDGTNNIGIGTNFHGGVSLVTGLNNIYIGTNSGSAESGQIRIGRVNTHTHTWLAGEATLVDGAGSSALTLGGSGTNGPHGIVFDDETAGAGLQLFFRTSPNQLVLEKTSAGTGTDGADAFSYDRDTDDFFFLGRVGIARTPGHPLHVGTSVANGNGAHLTAGGVWTNGSSRAWKRDFEAVDAQQVLERVAELPIARWRYQGDDPARHLGPVAEDFHAAFGLGSDERYIGTVDADGVALAAIQGLHALVERQREELERLRERVAQLEEEGPR